MDFVLKTRSTQVSIPNRELVSKLPSEPDSIGAEMQFEPYQDSSLLSVTFVWSAELGDGSYTVKEEIFLGLNWFILFSVPALGLPLALLWNQFTGFSELVSTILIVFLSLGLTASLHPVLTVESPVEDWFAGSGSLTSLPILPVIISLPVVVGAMAFLRLSFVVIVYAAYLMIFYFKLVRTEDDGVDVLQVSKNYLNSLPLIISNHFLISTISIFFIGMFLYGFQNGLTSVLIDLPVLTVLLVFLTLFFYKSSYSVLVRSSRSQEARFSSRNRSRSGIMLHTGFSVITSLLFVYLSWNYLRLVFIYLSEPFLFLDILILLGVVGLPIMFLLTGLVYQIWKYFETLRFLWNNCVKRSGFSIDKDVYVLDYNGSYAGAFAPPEAVIVSQGLLNELSEDEVECVLRHEEAHLENADALLGSIVVFLSLFLFTGKNVLYAALDYNGRELAADRYAVEQIGDPELYAETLSKVEEFSKKDFERLDLGITPTLVSAGSVEVGSLFQALDLYFGSFAVSKSHPSISTRIEQVKARSN